MYKAAGAGPEECEDETLHYLKKLVRRLENWAERVEDLLTLDRVVFVSIVVFVRVVASDTGRGRALFFS